MLQIAGIILRNRFAFRIKIEYLNYDRQTDRHYAAAAKKIIATLEAFTIDQLNTIPAGFNNNILWNLGHMIAAQQGVCYKRAGLDTRVSDSFFQAYKPDTKPEGYISEEQLNEIKTLLITSLEQLESDYKTGILSNYPTWTTRYGVEITSIEDAIAFLPFHDGLHVGYIMGMRKLV